jgi:hypothetical protein
MWKHKQSGDGFIFADFLRPGTSRIVVSCRNWVEATGVSVRVFDAEEREVRLIAIGRDLHGAADLSQRPGARLKIESSGPPARLAIWSHSRSHSAELWRRVLPSSLACAIGDVPGITRYNPAAMAESLTGGELSAALDEIASAWLGEGLQGDAIADAVALLQHLALHPLHRSNKLGALVAALCQKQGTI